jgi:Cytochrome c7 and related cytochrome c/Class III cytochrome C family
MAQIFKHSTNLISRVSIYGSAVIVALLGYAIYALTGSPFVTDVNVARDQPVPFSHKHHVGELDIDCRYCHTSVEQSSFAGLPPTQTCMTCHSQIWIKAPILEPVRASYRDDKSIEWNRVNALPDFVYFNHSIHVDKGVGCTTCHGPIAEMPLTWSANTLQMSWCTGCHREPEKYVRPKEYVFSVTYQPPANQVELGTKLLKEYNIHTSVDCYTCHR